MFSIKKITLKGSLESDITNDECPICKLDVFNNCIDCINKSISCYSVQGCCSHVYHFHCIDKWTKNVNNICPLDKQIWSFKKLNNNNNNQIKHLI
jgi:RING-box protein 1